MESVSSPADSLRDQRRRVLQASALAGLDSVSVEPLPPRGAERRFRLRLHFVPSDAGHPKRRAVPAGVGPRNVAIWLGGALDPRVEVEEVRPAPGAALDVLVRVTHQDLPRHEPLVRGLELREVAGLDPLFTRVSFSFDAADAAARLVPLPAPPGGAPAERVEIDYLAKDFDSFRQLMLERMAFYIPEWVERNPSDLGVTLVEVLAYAADYLSYYQDAVATEAYLDTARRRISVRRHTRLLDFRLQEGTNARTWVRFQIAGAPDAPPSAAAGVAGVAEGSFVLPAGSSLLSAANRVPTCLPRGSKDHQSAMAQEVLVFETMHPAVLRAGHNRFDVYTWGADDYALARGAVAATLLGHHPHLAAGDVLVLERRGAPGGGDDMAAADPRKRQAVRLARPPELVRDPLTGAAITEVRWHDGDALAADFPVSRRLARARRDHLTVVWGNVVLADHGEEVTDLLPEVPPEADGEYAPRLPRLGLTWRQPFDAAAALTRPAADATAQVAWLALPAIQLTELPADLAARLAVELPAPAEGEEAPRPETALPPLPAGVPRWQAQYDLLGSGRFARDFVVEMDDEGLSHLRFGDGAAGRRPAPGTRLSARYRIGIGPRGDVGPHAIRHLVVDRDLARRLAASGLTVEQVRNPLSGTGGGHGRAARHAQIYAPDLVPAEDAQRRCATLEDHLRLARRHGEVAAAAGRLEWGGSAPRVVLYLQRAAGLPFDAGFAARVQAFLAPFLVVGRDLVLRAPRWVPLEVEATVWLAPGTRPDAVLRAFAAAGGRFFPLAGLSFGTPVHASRLTARILEVPGVVDVRIDVFRRWGEAPAGEMEAGFIPIGPFEIPRLANDPEAPQHGTLRLRFEEEPRAPR